MDSQYSFTKVSENSKSEVEDIVRSSNVYSNFSSFYTLNTYFNSTGKELFIAKTDRDRRILFLRKRNSDVRILFNYSTSDQKLINDIKRHFKPNYLAYNLLGKSVNDTCKESVRQEAVVDLETITSMSEPKLKRNYAIFGRKHPEVVFRKIDETHKELIGDFLVEWSKILQSKLQRKITSKNDKRLLELYLENRNVGGGVALDGKKVIGLTLYVPSAYDGYAVGFVNKNLRGYTQLGVWLSINRYKMMQKEGYKKALIGSIKNTGAGQFKKQFLKNGRFVSLYAHEVFRSPDLKTKDNYLGLLI